MADGRKVYSIEINGVKESVDAVDSLNKQLDALEKKMSELSSKGVNIKTSGGSTLKELNAEERVLRKIWALDDKIEEAEDSRAKVLQNQKKVLKEITNEVKAQAAEARLANNEYANTMNGLKAKLADIKAAMGNMDIGGDMFKKYTKEANEITQKLKEIEQSYGQFGRNVGNYQSAADGFKKIQVAVGGTTREYNNYRDAIKNLKQERFELSRSLGQEAEEYKEVDRAVKQLESDYKDLDKSSKFMDNMLDTARSFASIASIGMGLSQLFGLDDEDFQESMQKFAGMTLVLQGIDKLMLDIQKKEGLFGKLGAMFVSFSDRVSTAFGKAGEKMKSFYNEWRFNHSKLGKELKSQGWTYDKGKGDLFNKGLGLSYDEADLSKKTHMTELLNQMPKVKEELKALSVSAAKFGNAVRSAAKMAATAIASIGAALGLLFLPELFSAITNGIKDFVKSLNTTKVAADRAAESLKALNKEFETRRDLLASAYLRRSMTDEEYLTSIYKNETSAIYEQIAALQTRAKVMQKDASNILNIFKTTQNTEFTGKALTGETTVGVGRSISFMTQGNDLNITIQNIEELEKAWDKCNQAISEGKDYLDKWGSGVGDWVSSLFVTVSDTEKAMRGLGNIRLSDFIADFQEVNRQFNRGEIDADQFARELERLKNEMNDNKIINSVIANLDKYIPDDEVRQAVQNIINEIYRLDDAFNMTSPQQVHYWNMVRIEGMKEGWKKTKAQLDEEERYEIEQTAHTEEQKNLVRAKYAEKRRKAQEQENKKNAKSSKKSGKSLQDIENELMKLRTENMEEGYKKQLKMIDDEEKIALQKIKDYGKLKGEIEIEIQKKYQRQRDELRRKWEFDTLKMYEDLQARIDQLNKQTFEKEVDTAKQNTEMKEMQKILEAGYMKITPTSYDDTKSLEDYYRKVYEIQKDALDKQTQIQQESLDKQLDYAKQEEELRYKRITDENGGEYVQQLRAGLITQEQYDELIERETNAHNARMNALEKKYESDSKKNLEDNLKDQQELYAQSFDNIVNLLKEKRGKIDEAMSMQPIVDNSWGVINYSKTNKNYKAALAQYDELKDEIAKKQIELQIALQAHKINPEDFAIAQKDLDEELKGIDQSTKQILQSQRQLFGDFMQSLQTYIQAVGQAATSIIQSIGEINDAAYERQVEAMEKQTELLEQQLEKQKALTEKYADDVDSIEDELQTARGDRRQHLIDQLNAQMAAQRESLAQEKRIEKEQERLDKKKQKLEEENNKRKKRQAITTALINAALSISAAAVNSYPIPAIPMMALAAAVGAAQVAAVKSAKYADGGLLVGKSHREGGIKTSIGTNPIELEGQEYVVNKKTTMQNLDLMEFINSKKRRVDLADMIDFYSSAPKKSINAMKTKFADGGQLPTLRTDIEINNRLIQTMEEYANRPAVVEVTEILNKIRDVQSVQVLAGLTPSSI